MSRLRLENKTALVTGAAQGIGRAATLRFIEEGARVIACDINEDKLRDLQGECGCDIRPLDVRDAAGIEEQALETKTLNILFNCAGYVHSGTILDCEEADWQRSLDINVTSMYRLIKAFLPAMINSGNGSIINMSSVASSIKGVPNRFAYSMSKAAVIGLTKSVAADFVGNGIRCNAICPGTVQTPSLEERLRSTGDYEKTRAAFVARQPMGRIGGADEIAELALYLASDESSYTTGTVHIIDGGWTN